MRRRHHLILVLLLLVVIDGVIDRARELQWARVRQLPFGLQLKMRLVSLALFPTTLYAFQHSAPINAAFSSIPNILDHDQHEDIIRSQLCEHSAIVYVHQPGLLHKDLYSLPATSPLSQMFRRSPSKTFSSTSLLSYDERVLANECGAQLSTLELGGRYNFYGESKTSSAIISIHLPEIQRDGRERKNDMSSLASTLATDLASIEEAFGSIVVVITGSAPSVSTKRDTTTRVDTRSPFFLPPGGRLPSPLQGRAPENNTSLPTGGIFHRYQLLTPGLLTTLVVTLLILFPIVFVGITALSSIQAPQRMEAPGKSDRKAQ